MKRTYLLGSVILGILAILTAVIVLTATGVFGGNTTETLVFSTGNAENSYNGKPLTNDKWELVSGELRDGHTIEANVYGTQTEVGVSENHISVKILDENKADVTQDYIIECRPGTLKVNPRPIKILSGSATKQYDGTPITSDTYQIVSGGVVSGHHLVVDFGSSRTEVGTDENIVTSYVYDANNVDVTSNYTIEAISGKLTITGYPLTIWTPSLSGVYNGMPLVLNEYEHISGELKNGDTMKVTVIGSRTEVGQSENDFEIQIISPDGVDVTSRYDVTKALGILEVLPRQLLVTTEGKTVVYNGNELVHKVYDVQGSLATGHTIEVAVTGKVIGVGSSDNTFFAEIRDGNGNIVTSNYEIHEQLGVLEVLPVDIVITSSSAYKKYDGTPLESSDYELSIGRLLQGHSLKVVVTGKQDKVGAVDNTFIYEVTDSAGKIVTELYSIEAVYGTLEIEPVKITLSTRGETKTYDSKPLILNGDTDWGLVEGVLYPGHTITAKITGGQYTVGTSVNTLEYTILNENGEDISEVYQVTEEFGELTILPLSLTIVTEGATKPYDSQPLTNSNWSIVSGELFPGHQLIVEVTGIQHGIGKCDNAFVFGVFDAEGADVTDVYAVEGIFGELEIMPRQLTIVTPDATKIYDGTPLTTENTWELLGGELFPGHVLEATVIGSITDVGEAPNTVALQVYDENGNDVSYAYSIAEGLGTLRVLQAELTIKTGSASKVYDGTPITNSDYEITSGELLSGHTLEMVFIGEQTEVGRSSNMFTYIVLNEKGEEVTANYYVGATYGELRIDPIKLVIYTGSGEKIYDGQPLTNSDYWIHQGDLISGHALTVVTKGSQTKVGMGYNYADYTITDGDGNDVSECYDASVSPGPLEVTPIYISISSEDATKMYDGKQLKKESFFITRGDVLYEHSLTVFFNSFPVNVGEYDNKMDIMVIDDETGLDVTRNYDFSKNYGKLVITPRTVTIRTESDEKTYDGTPLVNHRWTVVSQTYPLAEHNLVVVVSGSQLSVGKSDNLVAELRVEDNQGNDVTYNYDLSRVQYGVLTVLDASQSTPPNQTPEIPETPPKEDEEDNTGSNNQDNMTLLATIYSSAGGNIYLREMSFGSYNGKTFDSIDPYGKVLDNKYGMSYLASFAMKNADMVSAELKIRFESTRYFLPYYLDTAPYDYKVQTSDVIFTDITSEASMYYYTYWYNGENPVSEVPLDYSDDELAYRSYVYDNYLEVPTYTRAYMEQTIEKEGFSITDPKVIYKVAEYIQGCAVYDLNFDKNMENNETDVVVAFMSKYQRGVCRHYAMAATLLLRTLGIPARYTVGVVAQDVAIDTWTEIYSDTGHAWTEVYIDGVGWLALEVTGSSDDGQEPFPGGNGNGEADDGSGDGGNDDGGNDDGGNDDGGNDDGGNDDGGNDDGGNDDGGNDDGGNDDGNDDGGNDDDGNDDDGNDDGNDDDGNDDDGNDDNDGEGDGEGEGTGTGGGSGSSANDITMTPVLQRKKYEEGAELFAVKQVSGNDLYRSLVQMGYIFEYDIDGYINYVGYADSVISNVRITDPLGNDVTSEYDVITTPGKLHMYYEELIISSPNIVTDYTGNLVKGEEYNLQSQLLPGHTLSVTFGEGKRDAGTSYNSFSCIVRDENGVDVTYMYWVRSEFGLVIINSIKLVITAETREMTMDELIELGGEYYASWSITGGELLDGHTISADVEGYIDDYGRCDTYVYSVVILDENGENVTKNYGITSVDGKLRVN